MLWSRETKDDRGKVVVAATWRQLASIKDEFGATRHEIAAWVFTRARKHGAITRTSLFLICWFPLLVYYISRLFGVSLPTSPWWALLLSIVAVFVSVTVFRSLMVFVAERAVHPDEVCASLVAEGFCGRCGTTLRGDDARPDQITECANCGAGWWGYRIVAPVWKSRPLMGPREPWTSELSLKRAVRHLPRSVLDHRDRLVATLDGRARGASLWWAGKSNWAVQIELQDLLRERTRTWRIRTSLAIGLVVSALVFVLVILAFAIPQGTWPPGELVHYVVAGIFGLIGTVPAFLYLPHGSPEATVRLVLEKGRCPTCVSLLAPKPDPDGCTVCPVCTAAWRIPEFTTALLPGFELPTKSSAAQSSVA